ncbi:MAG: TAXI family TRAP transporter solute-binding subunit [Lachnospiraceae bacterium]|nr:TAXI family TRAP transporter solute-binding subunit [Clostridiales bacterium]MDD6292805.1 TAXI family TRAP transporter solute-binding subunit [Eubacteriales bacterium]MDY2608495.1 TAXI family TRAP transporter solute-binding subunit [Lachnospiraceae bacterium]
MRRKILSTILVVASFTIMMSLGGCGMKKDDIRLGTAGEGGMYYSFGDELSNKISSEENLKIKVKETAGSAANLRLLSKKYIELGIAQADLINDAYNGTGEFEDNAYKGYSAIAGLYTEACQIVVMNDSDILCIDDLQGKKVSIGEHESGTERNAKQILQAYGFNETLVEMKNHDYKTAVNKLENGEIDALFCTAGIKTEIIDELASRSKIRLLSIDDNQMEKITSTYDFLTEYDIPANTYEGQAKDIQTIGVESVLLASDKLDEDIVYKITKFLFEHGNELQFNSLTDLELTQDSVTQGITIKFHKGAVKYYKKSGIDVENNQ